VDAQSSCDIRPEDGCTGVYLEPGMDNYFARTNADPVIVDISG